MSSEHPPCPRCYSQRGVLRPWVGFKVIRTLWIGGIGLWLLALPFLAMDFVITLPALMIYALAAGPVFGLASQQPICRNCGLGRPKPGWHETPVRPVPSPAPAQWVARNHAASEMPAATTQDDEPSGSRPLPGPSSLDG